MSETNTPSSSVAHPHEFWKGVPNFLSKQDLIRLSRLTPWKAFRAVGIEWAMTLGMIALSEAYWHPALYAFAVIFIGARQHAFTILGHEGSHFILLKNRFWNEWAADLLMWWPTFYDARSYRVIHAPHHQYLATEKDANRKLWNTHNPDGTYRQEWVYPKSPGELTARILYNSCGIPGGIRLIKRAIELVGGAFGKNRKGNEVVRLAFYASVFGALTYFHAWSQFLMYWVIPYCTWRYTVNYIRYVLEHYAVPTHHAYNLTRTTVPSWFDLMFFLPRNISFHIEHHFYPSIPFYNLPEAHALMMENAEFRRIAHITRGVGQGLIECTRLKTPESGSASQNTQISA